MERDRRKRWISLAEKELYDELDAYQRNGCRISLNGRESYPARIVNACFREHNDYMRDFVGDEDQVITQIDFTRLRRTENKKLQ